MATEVAQGFTNGVPAQTDLGQNSGSEGHGSGGQASMLELLSVTDAAVKALNKSTRSQSSTSSRSSAGSHGSKGSRGSQGSKGSSHHSERSNRPKGSGGKLGEVHLTREVEDDLSHDSGVVSKTHTISEAKSKKTTHMIREHSDSPINIFAHDRSSDESTTASDVLIRSTLADPQDRSLLGLNASVSSKCSRTSFGMENFNTSGPQKVKISTKHLREIKSPFESDVSGAGSDSNKVAPALLKQNGGQVLKERKISSRDSRQNSNGAAPSKQSALPKKADVKSVSNGTKQYKENGLSSTAELNMEKNIQQSYPQVQKEAGYNSVKVQEVVLKGSGSDIQKNMAGDTNFNSTNGKNGDKKKMSPSELTNNRPKFERDATNGKLRFGREVINSQNSSQEKETTGRQEDKRSLPQDVPDPTRQLKSTPKYFIEKHTPQKVAPSEREREEFVIPERKNLSKEFDSVVEVIPQKEGQDSSSSSSQPEIVTVPERIVTVPARTSVFPSPSGSDFGGENFATPAPKAEVKSTPPALQRGQYFRTDLLQENRNNSSGSAPTSDKDFPGKWTSSDRQFPGKSHGSVGSTESDDGYDKPHARFQFFSRTSGISLQQGAPVTGPDDPGKHKESDDVQISKFNVSEKQRLIREAIAKRSNGGPVKRVVQPRFVGKETKSQFTSNTEESKPVGQSSEAMTAAVAASAAVAATQPFLKAQFDLEQKMAEILQKVSGLQGQDIQSDKPVLSAAESDRVLMLEKQLQDLTGKRLDYLEKIQQQQMDMQAKLLSMTRDVPGSRPTLRSPSRSPPRSPSQQRRRDPSPTSQVNKAFMKSKLYGQARQGDYWDRVHKYSSHEDDLKSPLDTPAPRSKAPKPVAYDTSDIEYRSRKKSPPRKDKDGGILRTILDYAGSPGRNVSFSREGRSRSPTAKVTRWY